MTGCKRHGSWMSPNIQHRTPKPKAWLWSSMQRFQHISHKAISEWWPFLCVGFCPILEYEERRNLSWKVSEWQTLQTKKRYIWFILRSSSFSDHLTPQNKFDRIKNHLDLKIERSKRKRKLTNCKIYYYKIQSMLIS